MMGDSALLAAFADFVRIILLVRLLLTSAFILAYPGFPRLQSIQIILRIINKLRQKSSQVPSKIGRYKPLFSIIQLVNQLRHRPHLSLVFKVFFIEYALRVIFYLQGFLQGLVEIPITWSGSLSGAAWVCKITKHVIPNLTG